MRKSIVSSALVAIGLLTVSGPAVAVEPLTAGSSGPTMVGDVGEPEEMIEAGGKLFYVRYSGQFSGNTGRELWTSNGSELGTHIVKDIYPGPGDAFDQAGWNNLIEINGTLYFAAVDGVNGWRLWTSDGSELGTNPVAIGSAKPQLPNAFANIGGRLYFAGQTSSYGREPWISDGTSLGTVQLADINSSGSSNPYGFTKVGTKTFFVATNSNESDYEPYVTDGTGLGTHLVANINPAEMSFSGGWGDTFVGLGGIAYFNANDGVKGHELWRTDGTDDGTWIVKNIRKGSTSGHPGDLTKLGQKILFVAKDAKHGLELWTTDGTSIGTKLLKDIRPGRRESGIRDLVRIGSTIYFSATDGVHGMELWKTNGTTAGTVMVKNIRASGSSNPGEFTGLGNRVFFSANDGPNGREVWTSNGTELGTVMLDLEPDYSASPSLFVAVGDTMYFKAFSTNTFQWDLWKYVP